MLLAVLMIGLVTLYDPVYGTTCQSNTTCVATKYTVAECSATQTCTCVSGFFPIRTGCGKKFPRPDLFLWNDYYSKEVLEGKSAILTCDTFAQFVDWYYDNGVFITTGINYTITSASAANVGKIKCKAKLGSTSSDLDSDFSAPLEIKLIPKGGTITVTPVFQALPTSLFAGKKATLTCSNIPMGYDTAKIKYMLSNGTEVTSPLTMTSDLAKENVKCILTDTSAHSGNKESSLDTLPLMTTTIIYVFVYGNVGEGFIYSADEAIMLTCQTTPDPLFLDTESTSITYQWLNNGTVVQNSASATYSVPQTEGIYLIACSATYNGSTFESTSKMKINRSASVVKPTIIANPVTPEFGSRLTLACGTNYTDGYYSWKIGTEYIAQQFDHTIQLDSLTTSDAGNYVCNVTRNMVTMTSDVFTISIPSK
ncbi:uncharacterized protein LOC106078778 isoform X2 [Biomphalaria glabrata]|uniref:Uncharacterized protein LOC106078778 isoform X2 n=1 Tax=Biomphalaria glabrata TaxID=6526 RepID=A0A9W3BJN2_BIOGL|nr:uncharacterized protein LOC106078778 isoform X2 [Biomphalaria glabrata]